MDSDVMDKCCKMVGAIFSRHTSPSRRRDASPQAVDVIRSVPQNGVLAKEATGAYKAGVWVWDVSHARTSPRPQRHKHGDGDVSEKDQRKCQSMERSGGQFGIYPQLPPPPPETKTKTPSMTSVLDNDEKREKLSKSPPPPPSTQTEKLDIREKYMTLPATNANASSSSKQGKRHSLATLSRNPHSEDPGSTQPSRNSRRSKDEEVRRLAKTMVNSIENLIGNLHGIVGDLRQLVQQIDAVTESIDTTCPPARPQRAIKAGPERKMIVTTNQIFTQTDLDQQCRDSLGHSEWVQKYGYMQASSPHRYSYPQYYSPVSSVSSPSGYDTDRRMYRRSRSSRKSGDSGHPSQKSSSSQHQSHKFGAETRDTVLQLRQIEPARTGQQRQVPWGFGGAPFEETQVHSAIPSKSSYLPDPSIPFLPVESPPNPAPTLFGAYADEEKTIHVKDSDSLPDRGLKTWKEKMERHSGSADSLTPQMDWSYLVLTDHNLTTSVEGFNLSPGSRHMDPLSPQKDWFKLQLSSHKSESRRSQKDRSRLSQTGVKMKHHVGAIPGIPEQREPCDSSYDSNCDVFLPADTCSSSSTGSVPPKRTGASVPQFLVNEDHQKQNTDQDPQTVCSVSQETGRLGVFPQVQQSIGGASLGWSTRSKALPNWPSEELSSIGASDNEIDDLSSPFLQQQFQYPRRSSAKESNPETKNGPEVNSGMNRTISVSDTIASGGFEVRNDIETSPESDTLGPYGGQYESAMESRLETLTNEVEGSDFSDADADVGSDVLEQSLTSLEDSSSVKYDRELNTWTSYTMTHIDSDDVVSECTSDVLNENYFDTAMSNPGFDDVSLNFDDIGFLPLPLQTSKFDGVSPRIEKVSPSLE